MKHIKKTSIILALCFTLTSVIPSILPGHATIRVNAAAIRLNKSKVTLRVGNTYKLKIKGTSRKVTWSSNKKKVATVDKFGNVTAKKAGSAVIMATVRNKTYPCVVTVKKKAKSNKQITFNQAKRIALNKVGGGTVTDIDQDYENGRLVYEIEVYYKGMKYDLEIDAKSGKVLYCILDD